MNNQRDAAPRPVVLEFVLAAAGLFDLGRDADAAVEEGRDLVEVRLVQAATWF